MFVFCLSIILLLFCAVYVYFDRYLFDGSPFSCFSFIFTYLFIHFYLKKWLEDSQRNSFSNKCKKMIEMAIFLLKELSSTFEATQYLFIYWIRELLLLLLYLLLTRSNTFRKQIKWKRVGKRRVRKERGKAKSSGKAKNNNKSGFSRFCVFSSSFSIFSSSRFSSVFLCFSCFLLILHFNFH